MNPSSPSIDEIFLAAIEKDSPEDVENYLAEVCITAELRVRVQRLLQAHRQAADSFLKSPASGLPGRPAIAPDQVVDVEPESLEAGLAATFGPESAVIIGGAGHSVLKSLGKKLAVVPNITLHDSHEDRGRIVQPGSPELRGKADDSRYQLMGEIARGGMGAIIKGRDSDLGRDIAIKVLLDSHKDKPELIQRFVEEAQIGGQLQHPGIVPVYELGQFGDQRPFFSMKLVKGKTFADLLAKRKEPSEDWPKLLGIFEQICQAMAYAHSKGVIHRDLKPANIMVGAFGEVQVMDWGLSKVLRQGGIADELKSLDKHRNVSVIQTRRSVGSDVAGEVGSDTQLGSAMGTPAYMPPEQALGEIDRLDARADVFGLGAILAEILTGQPPYVGTSGTDTFRMASRCKLEDCHTRLDASGADPQLIAVAKTALSPEPEDRMRDAGELTEGVTKYLEGVQERLKQTEIARVQAQTRMEEERRRKKLYVAIAGLMFVVAVGGAVGAVLYKQFAERQRQLAQSETEARNVAEQAREAEEVSRLKAEQEAQRANVMRLAAEAQRIEEDLPIQSVLLAMEAVQMADAYKLWPIPAVHETLLKVTANLGGMPLLNQQGIIGPLAISQNDRMITHDFVGIGESDGDSFRVWNLTNDDPAASSLKLELDDRKRAWSRAISADGRRMVTGNIGSASVWEVSADGDQVGLPTDLPGQVGEVTVAISPDGQWVVTATTGASVGRGNTVGRDQLWKIDERGQATLVAELEPNSNANRKAFAFSPNNHWLVMVAGTQLNDEGRAFIWNLQSKEIASSVQSLEHAGVNPSVAIGRDGRWLVTGSSDGVRLFDLTANDMPASVRQLTRKKLGNVTVSEDCRWLIAAGVDSMLFDLSASEPASSTIILAGGGHESFGHSVAISPDNRWLATGAKNARIWDLNSIDPLELPILKDHAGNSARLWDVNAAGSIGKTFVMHGPEDMVTGMHFTSDSRRLLVGSWDGTIRTWNIESENPGSSFVLRGHTAPIWAVAISPDLRWAVTGSEDHTARLWDLASDTPSASSIILPHPEFVRTLAISPDSHWLVTASGHLNHIASGSATEARVWDLTARDPSKSMRILSGHERMVTHVKISPDSQRVVTLSYDGTARVWSLDGANPAKEPRVLSGHAPNVHSVAFSPDGNSLVTGDFKGNVSLWDLTAPDPIAPRVLLSQDNWVLGLSLEANRARALTGGWQKKAHIWDLDLNLLTKPTSRELPIGLITPYATEFRGHLMCLPNLNKAEIWDLSADENTSPHLSHAHDSNVFATAFSPDGSRFASCGDDRTARITNLSTENPLNTTLVLRGHESGVSSVAISTDNRWVLTGSFDNTARLWDMDIERLMVRARKLVGRELNDEERGTFAIPKRETPSP